MSFPFGTAPALALASIALLTLSCKPRDQIGEYAGVIVSRAYDKPDVWLTDTEGRRFNFREATKGKVALVEFGYTKCPDVCPVTVSNIASALAKQPYDVASQIQFYFVTQDPERDTPKVLREWLDHFNERFVGVTGPQAAIDSLAEALDIAQAALAKSSPADTGYAVGHSSQVVAFTRDGKAHLIYPFGVRQEGWTHDLPKLVAITSWTPPQTKQ
jgi:protein SCO1/2